MRRPGRARSHPERARAVVVVGAGASGLLSARALLGAGHRSVVLIERDRSWSAGPAYATRDPGHLLNVVAGKLSVDTDRPTDFVEWTSRRVAGVAECSFLPRSLFGQYLRESLDVAAGAARTSTLTRVTGDVVTVDARSERRGSGTRVVLADGRSIEADHIVLALGNPAPRRLCGNDDAIINDPWAACFAGRVCADDSVVLVGSGLTAVDVALSLTARGHRAPIHMVSRRGLLPRRHADSPSPPIKTLDRCFGPTARSAVAWMRAAIADAGGDWRAVFDGIRHDTNDLWQRLPEGERARLLRHAGRHWEVHRHRIAPEVAARVNELLDSRRLDLRRGTVTHVEPGPGGTSRVVTRDTSGAHSVMPAHWVVNCTGPDFDLRRSECPVVRNLFAQGLARPGSLGLGLDIGDGGSLVDASSRASSAISVVGPLRRGVEWETTAIPDIRPQAEALAARLIQAQHRRTVSVDANV